LPICNREIGFIFQQFNLLTRANAMKNVMLPALYAGMNEKRSSRAIQLLERVGLKTSSKQA